MVKDHHVADWKDNKIFNVATTFTPKMVIENVLKGADAGKWAITEVVEKGDGAWAKVSSLYTTLTFFQFTLSRAHSLSSRRAMLTFNLHRARRSSTPVSEPAVPSPAWAGRASAETCCRRSGLLCTRFEDWG